MLFSDPVFFFFFAVYFACHFFLPARHRIWLIIAGSAVFYAWWRPAYVWLPFAMTLGAFAGAAWIDGAKERRSRRLRLATTLIVGFLPLAFIKYAFFLANDVLGLHGAIDTAQLRYPLPLGLSFITFTLSAYVIDVYRGKYPLEPSLKILLGYVLFFPHLIAGPILRPHELMPQLRHPSPAQGARLKLGIAIFTMGLVKKLIFADSIAQAVDKVYQHGGSGFEHLIALYGFSVQIYCDFSGYTDMAIGIAYLLRVRLPTNFLRPYGARSIVDFWRRWHITLSHWLRDYLYIPLGGNRGGKARQIRNILITMLLGGLWHGASWTFVIWGGLHGVALGFVHLISRYTAALPRWLSWLLTFHFVTFAWIFFRARDFASAQRFIAETLTSAWSTAGAEIERNAFVVILLVLFALTHWLDRHARLRVMLRRANPLLVWLGIAFCWMLAITISQGSSANFIYFDF
jgi:alginate O-acetyltransferase complex protein AlgI